MEKITLKSYVKINLTLEVASKLENGFHEIKSIMQQLDYYDTLHFRKLDENEIIVKCNNPELEGSKNICYKAAEIIKKKYGVNKGIEIKIEKNIPIGAGLGGGSGNAAAAFKAMNLLFNLNLNLSELASIAKEIGSDIPFQIYGGTFHAKGIGEKLEKIKNLKNAFFVLINPGIHISTPWAYSEIDKYTINNSLNNSNNNFSQKTKKMSDAIFKENLEEIASLLYNDFERAVFAEHKEIEKIKKELLDNDALGSLMSGSGSTVFGIFDSEKKAKKACENLKEKYPFVESAKPKNNLDVKLSKNAGFCVGVKRALREIKRISGEKKIYVLGKLIHNPQVVRKLEKSGVIAVDSTKDLKKGSTVVITAHGIADSKVFELEKNGFIVVDLTCPLVKRVHDITKKAEKEGRRIIIFGDKNHIEVKGIIGNLNTPIVVLSPDEAKKEALELDKSRKYSIVSQTTQNIEKFNEIIEIFRNSGVDIGVEDTICMPTKQRQSESVSLAKSSDIMIIIGGKISANTKKLAQRCSEFTKTYHIETEKELNKEWFTGMESVGISAGASTPDYIIKRVYDYIENELY